MLLRWIQPLFLACIFLASPFAQASSARAQGDKVYVNEVLILTLRYGDAGQLTHRAEVIADKFAKLSKGDQLTIDSDGYSARIMAGDEALLTVTPEEAAAQNQSAAELASSWLQNLKDALILPPIQLSTTMLRIPVGAKAKVQTQGSEIENCQITVSNPGVVATFHKHELFYVRAVSLGSCDVSFAGPSSSQTLHIDVQPYAANLPQTFSAEVSGEPASQDTVAGAIQSAMRAKVQCQPDANLSYQLPDVKSIPFEEERSFKIPVKITALNAFPVDGEVDLDVHNVPLAHRNEAELWYSNDPEDVRSAGNLFAARLLADKPVRLLYHHDNAADFPLAIQVRILNSSDQTAKVLIIAGDAKPDKNPVLAGYEAGDRFLENWIKSSGEIVDIPAHSELPVAVHKLYPSETMSGLTYLRLLTGGPSELLVRTDAEALESLPDNYAAAFTSREAWQVLGPQPIHEDDENVRLSNQLYPDPFQTINVNYRVGGKFGFALIGQKPLRNVDANEELEGNFGVMYTVNIEAVNPTALPVDVEVTYQSGAGYSGGLFVVDGSLLAADLLQPQDQVEIGKIHLEAGDSKSLSFLTCPLSGSSYPATVTVRTMTPLDAAAKTFLHTVK